MPDQSGGRAPPRGARPGPPGRGWCGWIGERSREAQGNGVERASGGRSGSYVRGAAASSAAACKTPRVPAFCHGCGAARQRELWRTHVARELIFRNVGKYPPGRGGNLPRGRAPAECGRGRPHTGAGCPRRGAPGRCSAPETGCAACVDAAFARNGEVGAECSGTMGWRMRCAINDGKRGWMEQFGTCQTRCILVLSSYTDRCTNHG